MGSPLLVEAHRRACKAGRRRVQLASWSVRSLYFVMLALDAVNLFLLYSLSR